MKNILSYYVKDDKIYIINKFNSKTECIPYSIEKEQELLKKIKHNYFENYVKYHKKNSIINHAKLLLTDLITTFYLLGIFPEDSHKKEVFVIGFCLMIYYSLKIQDNNERLSEVEYQAEKLMKNAYYETEDTPSILAMRYEDNV